MKIGMVFYNPRSIFFFLFSFYICFFPPRFLLKWIQSFTGIRFFLDRPNCVAITIDDGPTEQTANILDILAKHRVKATFFCIGDAVSRNPIAFSRIIREGHQVGNHDWIDRVSAISATEKDIIATSEITGAVQFFRPGSGLVTPRLWEMLKKLKLECVLGDSYGHDCQIASVWFQTLFLLWRCKSQSIIILHDKQNNNTSRILDNIIPVLKQRNLRFITL